MSVKSNDKLKSKVFNLNSLVEYQENSVVSKVLIGEKAGTITVFAFDKHEELSEHTAPFDAFVQVLDGEIEIKISGVPNVLQQGDMIIMPANEPHALKALSKMKMLLVLIKPD